MPIPKNIIKQIELDDAKIPKKTVKIIVENHQTRINIPSEISEAMQIKKNDEMELTFEDKKPPILIGKLLRKRKWKKN